MKTTEFIICRRDNLNQRKGTEFIFFLIFFFSTNLYAQNLFDQRLYWSPINDRSALLLLNDSNIADHSLLNNNNAKQTLFYNHELNNTEMNNDPSKDSCKYLNNINSFSHNIESSNSFINENNLFFRDNPRIIKNGKLDNSVLKKKNGQNVLDVSVTSSPILRGNISELSIEPYNGRITGNIFGEWATIDSQGHEATQSGFKTQTLGGGLGQDRLLGNYVIWGFWLNGLDQKMKMSDERYSGSIQSFSGRLHLSIFGAVWYADLAIGVGKNWNEHRMDISQANDFVNKYTGTQWNYEGEFGLRIFKGHTKVEPFLGMRIINLDEPGTAGIFPESTVYIPTGYSFNSYRTMLGSRLAWEYSTYLADISPIMQAAWIHEFGDTEIFTTNDFMPFPVAYQFGNHKMSRDRFVLGAGLTLALKDSFDLHCFYHSMIVNNYQSSNVSGGFNKKF